VGHFHPTSWWRYLRTQARQGYYRIQLYRRHPNRLAGDSYSGWLDHLQPPLAALIVGLAALLPIWPRSACVVLMLLVLLLLLLQLPMVCGLVARLHDPRYLAFGPFSLVRAFARAAGMMRGCLSIRSGTTTP
jgi:hypothetical protein